MSPLSNRPNALTLAVALLFVCALNVVLGQVEFGGYDSSMLVDLGWRQHLGQVPYRDFPCMLPPGFYLLARAAVAAFGAHWWAFTLMSSAVWFLLAAAGCFCIGVCRDFLGASRSSRITALYILSLAVPFLETNHLWHSTLAAECIVLFLLVCFLQQERIGLGLRVSAPLAALSLFVVAALWLSKPNTALVTLFASVLLPLTSRQWRRSLVAWFWLLCGGALLACLVLWAFSVSPSAVFRSYLEVGGRPNVLDILDDFLSMGKDWSILLEATASYAIIVALIVMIARQILTPARRSSSSAYAVAAVGFVVTVVGFCTNWDVRMNDLAPALFGMCLLLYERHAAFAKPHPRSLRAVHCVLIFAVMLLAVTGIRRARMQSVGSWAGDVSGSLTPRYDTFFGPFVGRTGLWKTLAIVDQQRREHPTAKLFFGYRLEYQYARLGLTSPRHLPIWWHPGSSFAIGTEHDLALAFQAEQFDILFFPPRDIEAEKRFPAEIRAFITENYDRTSSPDSALDVYQRRTMAR